MFGKESVEKEFLRTYQRAMGETVEMRLSDLSEQDRKDYLYYDKRLSPSQFPFCGLRRIYTRMTAGVDPAVYDSFASEYFRNVGIVAHTALQNWLSRNGSFIGDYHCLECKHKHLFTTMPKKCKKCGSTRLEHRELGGKYGDKMGWRTDHVFRTRKGRLYLIDYKTTTSYQISRHKKGEKVFPYIGNKVQVESYVPLAEDRYNVKFDGCILVYAARDNPIWNVTCVVLKLDEERKAELRKRLKKWYAHFELSLVPTKENVQQLYKKKLCCDKQFYKENVHSDYNPCPLQKICFKKDKLVPELQAALKTYKKDQASLSKK